MTALRFITKRRKKFDAYDPFSWMMWGNEIHAREKLLFFFVFLPQSTEHWIHWILTSSSDNNDNCFGFLAQAHCWCIHIELCTSRVSIILSVFHSDCSCIGAFWQYQESHKYKTICLDSSPTVWSVLTFVVILTGSEKRCKTYNLCSHLNSMILRGKNY